MLPKLEVYNKYLKLKYYMTSKSLIVLGLGLLLIINATAFESKTASSLAQLAQEGAFSGSESEGPVASASESEGPVVSEEEQAPAQSE